MKEGQPSTADKLQAAAQARANEEAKMRERVETLRKCANRLFSTEDGIYFARVFCETSGVFKIETSLHELTLAHSEGKKVMYITFFRKLLDKDLLAKIERGE